VRLLPAGQMRPYRAAIGVITAKPARRCS
jgi:hypothetical protein